MTAYTASRQQPLVGILGWLRATREWTYAGGKRDLRFDLLRGFAVFAMIIDHINGSSSIFYFITGGDRFFVSAAECFVFLSGLLMGMVNGGLMHRGDIGGALTKVLNRAGMLYSLTIGLTFVTAVIPLLIGHPWLSGPQDGSLLEYAVGVLTLHRTANLVDVMLLYTILVLAAEPVLLLLEHGRTRLVVGCSIGLWLVWQIWPTSADIWPIPGDELFTVSAWQLLFVNALVIGFHRKKLDRVFRALGSPLALLAAGTAMTGLIALYFSDLAPLVALTGRDQATLTSWLLVKNNVAPLRVITFATLFIFAYSLTTVVWRPLERALGWLLLPLGQSALSAYVIHIFIMKALQILHPYLAGHAPTLVTNSLIHLAGVLMVWLAIRLRPVISASLEQLDSARSLAIATVDASGALLAQHPTDSIDIQLAQAQAHRDVDMLR